MTPFLVSEFGKSSISALVKECFGSQFPDVFNKSQVDYIYRYLKDLGAKSVVLESEYVDKDYLDDFAKYYVRRFGNRGHTCARLHFFSESWTHQQFERFLESRQPDDRDVIQEAYLGFVVVKPLPKTFIGKTCLKLYPAFLGDSSRLCIKRRYDVNLFGIDLYVESVAFQEQDKVVSACATTSIWCALHAVTDAREVPSCSEITINAINHISDSSNSFPSKELSNKQILRALDVERLRHHSHSLRGVGRDTVLELIRAHIRSGLPLILGADVYGMDVKGVPTLRAGHATTVLGIGSDADDPALYIHDDRLGPFARARLVDAGTSLRGLALETDWCLVLQEKRDDGTWADPKEVLAPTSLIAIANKKARLPFSLASQTCHTIRHLYERGVDEAASEGRIPSEKKEAVKKALGFSLELAEVGALKKEVWESRSHPASESPDAPEPMSRRKLALLTTSLARFQWLARFSYNGNPAFLLLIDATDIPQGDAVSAVYRQDETSSKVILELIQSVASERDARIEADEGSFIASFLRRLTPRSTGLQDYLDKTYGEPRAPLRLKPEEVVKGDMKLHPRIRRYYEPTRNSVETDFPDAHATGGVMIWVIDHEGTLLIAEEQKALGHPSLTGFKPARISGELRHAEGKWIINSKSGRYSGNYRNTNDLLQNALRRFEAVFPASRDQLIAEARNETDPCDG